MQVIGIIRSKEGRTYAICTVLCILFLSLMLELFSWAAHPPVAQLNIPAQCECLYPDVEHYVSGYNFDGIEYVPVNNDPQLGFALPGWEICTIILEFEEPLKHRVSGVIYYAVNGEELSEVNRIPVHAAEGSQYLVAQLPSDRYTYLRFDIDQAFSPAHIFTSPEEIKVEYDKPPFSWDNVILYVVATLCLYLVYLWFKEKYYAFTSKYQIVSLFEKISSVIIKYFWIECLCIILLAVVLQLNFSSMICYNTAIPNNIAIADMHSIGIPRGIRSDEYLVNTAKFFHNMNNGEYSVFALNISSIFEMVNGLFKLINPYYWGRLFLPTSYAFSWEQFIPIIFSFYMFYKLFYIITNNGIFSFISSLLIGFSPGFQWWSGPSNAGLFCGVIVLFYDFFKTGERNKKLLYSWNLLCIIYMLAVDPYPAWWVPYTYLFAMILLTIYLKEKKFYFKKNDAPYIITTVILIFVGIIVYYVGNVDAVVSQLETIYPGKRFCVGGNLPSAYWANYLTAPFTTWKPFDILGTNQSEISQFLHLFPIPTVIFLIRFREFKKNPIMLGLMAFKVLCMIYMVFGFGDFLAKYTLMSYTTEPRLSMLWGFASFLLLLLECYYIAPVNLPKIKTTMLIRFAIVNASIIFFLIWVIRFQEGIVSYIGKYFGFVAVGLIVSANLLFLGKKKQFLVLLSALTVLSGVIVNPVNAGTEAIQKTPLAMTIRGIDAQDTGTWIGLDGMYLPKYIYAQGVDCLNYLSWPPRFDLFAPLDESGENRDVYNRYAHVSIELVGEETSFQLLYSDHFLLRMNVNDLKKWNVRYIVTKVHELPIAENAQFDLIHYDGLDQICIHQVNYLP